MSSFWKTLRALAGLSERELASNIGLSRLTIRSIESGLRKSTLQNFDTVCRGLKRKSLFLVVPEAECVSSSSIVAVSLKIIQTGAESWPIHLMELVDHFRKSLDPRILLLPPVQSLDRKYVALLASTTLMLCEEVGLEPPEWALGERFLEKPWFVSESESLKASALLESPWAFRRNNIFVLENFLRRV